MKKEGPYIGITGFMDLHEVVKCDNAFIQEVRRRKTATARKMKFMVGVLVSSKTLVGGTNKWTDRYPLVSKITEIISCDREHLLHTIHYNTDDASTIDEQVDEIMKISPAIDAIQFNIKWASHVKLQRVRRKYPNLRIILQIGAGALREVDEPDDIHLGKALSAYEGVGDDYLIDPSGGEGKALDIWRAFACISDDEIPVFMQPGIAGGRDANNIEELRGLMRRLRCPVNIDAESRLRTSTTGGGHLDIDHAIRFTQAGVALISAF